MFDKNFAEIETLGHISKTFGYFYNYDSTRFRYLDHVIYFPPRYTCFCRVLPIKCFLHSRMNFQVILVPFYSWVQMRIKCILVSKHGSKVFLTIHFAHI